MTTEKKEKKPTTLTEPAATSAPSAAKTTAAPASANGYSSPYTDKINEITTQLLDRPAFEYNAADDQMWQQYLDKYQQGGKLAMKDSMGQAAALTGGYGSSYGQAVGQQTYDAYMQEAADILPELEQQAWDRYNTQGAELQEQLAMLRDAESTDYSRYTYNREWDMQQQQINRENVQAMISTTGYVPTDDELAAAGMTRDEAEAIAKGVAASDPDYAYRLGILSPEDYKARTGKWPTGYTPTVTTGSGGGYEGDGRRYSYNQIDYENQLELQAAGYDIAADGYWGEESKKAWEDYTNKK